jgi:hypothetical protein
MQTLINVLALTSFAVSAAIVSGGTYLYLNKDTLIEDARDQASQAIAEAMTDALPSMLDGAMPKIPSATGGAIPPVPSTTGPAIPMLP